MCLPVTYVEGTGSLGAGITGAVSLLVWVLGTEL